VPQEIKGFHHNLHRKQYIHNRWKISTQLYTGKIQNITFKFHLLVPSGSLGDSEKALPSISHAYSTVDVFPEVISRQNSSSTNLLGKFAAVENLWANALFAILSYSRKE
jgi:hypothetical protein